MTKSHPHRPRRLRRTEGLRALVRETRLSVDDLVFPVFAVEQPDQAGPIRSMPGVRRHTVSDLPKEVERILGCGVQTVLLFGVPAVKDALGSKAYDDDGVVPSAIRRIKGVTDRLTVMTDVCLCSYTDHGHCGVVEDGVIANDETLDLLSRIAVCHAVAGADVVAPSAMMDSMVGSIRQSLDVAGHREIAILSYAVKYASSFYGPFREAADSTPQFGDRRSYQMDPANAGEALREAKLDIDEGADAIMVKPAMPYLDVIRLVRDAFAHVPLFAYQVSGEYSMVKAACAQGWLDERSVVLEALTAMKRAGADSIITYYATDAARWLQS